MTDITLHLADEAATATLGARLARIVRPGDVIGLSGPLGAGKTTLARGLIAALTGVSEAPSPTFALVETYETPAVSLWHFDLYRLEKPDEAWELGLEEALDSGAALVEWPERIAGFLPEDMLLIRLDPNEGTRKARLRGCGDWRARLGALSLR